jgi:hypothetical protein
MCEHMHRNTQGDGSVGYIDRIVRANNSFIDLLAGTTTDPTLPTPWPVTAPLEPSPAGLSGGSLLSFAAGSVLGYLAIGALSARLRSA